MLKISTTLIVLLLVCSFILPMSMSVLEELPLSKPPIVPVDERPTDPEVLQVLQDSGIDVAYVKLEEDYGEGNPYSVTYIDTLSSERFTLIDQLPHVNHEGTKVEVGWLAQGATFISKPNLFSVTVYSNYITLICINDQPYGAKVGDFVTWSPQLYLNDVEQYSKSDPVLLAVDPYNENYQKNVLEWDYGIAKRRLRLIEGKLLERWVFETNPESDVRIIYNQSGSLKLQLGEGYDIAVSLLDRDTEFISKESFDQATYPVEIADSATFYPDEDPETSTVDGSVYRFVTPNESWAEIRSNPGNWIYDDSSLEGLWEITTSTDTDKYYLLGRSIFLFDTSSLPDDCTINSATLSFYSEVKSDMQSISPTTAVYSANPANNDHLVNADYGAIGSTEYSNIVAYADITTGGYYDFTLNASGIAAISKTGVSKFGVREQSYDVTGTPPVWDESCNSYWKVWFADKGEGYKPKLVVIYNEVEGSEVATTTDAGAIDITGQRKTFYANGRHWAFYHDGNLNMSYKTSTDGTSWSAETDIRAMCTGACYGDSFSVFFDGNYIHYAVLYNGHTIYYRRGVPESDGTITWSAAEQTVISSAEESWDIDGYVNIAVDTEGYPWIGYTFQDAESVTKPAIIKSSHNDGTWTHSAPFPLLPFGDSAVGTGYWTTLLAPVSGQDVVVVASNTDTKIKGLLMYEDGGWGPSAVDETDSFIDGGNEISATSFGSYAHIAFSEYDTEDITYCYYDASTKLFSSEETVVAVAHDISPTISVDDDDVKRVFWIGSDDHIYYKEKADFGSWGNATDWIDESTDGFSWYDRLTASYRAYTGQTGLLYLTKTSSPYNVKYGNLTTDFTLPEAPTGLATSNPTYETLDFSWTKGEGATYTRVRRKVGGYPTSPTDGINVYFGTGSNAVDGGLDSNTTYYYSAWSYTDPHYSDGYSQATGTTSCGPPTVTTQTTTNIEEITATGHGTITNTGGGNCTIRGFKYGLTQTDTWDVHEDGSFGNGTFSLGLSSLSPGTVYYIRAYATNPAGTRYGWWSSFTTKPFDPSGLTTSNPTLTTLDFSWTKGEGATYTRVRRKVGGYPTSPTDGINVYFGTGSNAVAEDLNGNTTYYFSAWSYTNPHYSDGYSQTTGMTLVPDKLMVVTLTATNVTTTSATFNGEILTTGNCTTSKRGFEWGPSRTATWTSEESGSFDAGTFLLVRTDLEADGIYFFRCWAEDCNERDYGDWYGFVTSQPDYTEQISEEDENNYAPPSPSEPSGWIRPPKDWGTIGIGRGQIPLTFFVFLLLVGGVIFTGLLLTKYTRSLGILFMALGFIIGVFCFWPKGGYLDWWVLFPYIFVGWALLVREQPYAWN